MNARKPTPGPPRTTYKVVDFTPLLAKALVVMTFDTEDEAMKFWRKEKRTIENLHVFKVTEQRLV